MKRTIRVIVVGIGTLVLAQFINGLVALFIGLIAITLWMLIDNKKRIQEEEMAKLGLTPEETQVIQDDLASGNKLAVVQHIQEAQERQRASLREIGIEPTAFIPLIGQDIKWAEVARQVFRVLEFDRTDTILLADGTVKAATLHKPYGYLLVESPILNVKARLLIGHSTDFALACTVYDDPKVVEKLAQNELLVTYFPKHKLPFGFGGITHALHYVITPRGTLERYYELNDDEHMRNPAPEKLFRKFVWDGEIRVEVNPTPEF